MKEETKQEIKEVGQAGWAYLLAHKGLRWFLIGVAVGLLACWVF